MSEKPEKTIDIEEHIKDIQDITIAIDSWDDVFSDFDPSPIDQRILSEDFLSELKKRYRETQRGNFIITIYAPPTLKDDLTEKLVTKRLKQYFKFQHLAVTKEVRTAIRKGFIFVFAGVIALSLQTFVTYFQLLERLAIELTGIILTPLGWFGIWEGFSRIIEPAPLLKQEQEIFAKLSKASIKFKYAEIPAQNGAEKTGTQTVLTEKKDNETR